jgi:aspartate/methionine/tyrosine aminotransferase
MSSSTVMQRALARRVAAVAGLPPHIGPPAAPLPPALLAAVREALLGGETHYTSRPGLPALRTAIAATLTAQGYPLADPDAHLLITAGVEEALTVVGLAYRGARVVVEPGAERAAVVLATLGLDVAPEGGGPAAPAFAYSTVGRGASAADQLVVHDVGAALWSTAPPRFTAADVDTVVIGSLDRLDGLPTFRDGFAAGPAPVIARLRAWKQALSICTAAPSQRAAIHALADRAAAGGAR